MLFKKISYFIYGINMFAIYLKILRVLLRAFKRTIIKPPMIGNIYYVVWAASQQLWEGEVYIYNYIGIDTSTVKLFCCVCHDMEKAFSFRALGLIRI